MRCLFHAPVPNLIFDIFFEKIQKNGRIDLFSKKAWAPYIRVPLKNSSVLIVLSQLKASRKLRSRWFHNKTFYNLFSLWFYLAILFDRIFCNILAKVEKKIFKKARTNFFNKIRDFVKNWIINPRCTV